MKVLARSFILVATIFMLLTVSANAAEKSYKLISPQQNTASEKIIVTEFFSYGCPHCSRFQPYFDGWKSNIPEGVELRQVPAIFSDKWANYARAFYAAKAMGVLDQFHQPMFDALHAQKRRLKSLEGIAKFAGSLGIDSDKFLVTMKSFTVSSQIKQAKKAFISYGVNAVPTVTVNGKYMTNGSIAGTYPAMITTIKQLIKKEERLK